MSETIPIITVIQAAARICHAGRPDLWSKLKNHANAEGIQLVGAPCIILAAAWPALNADQFILNLPRLTELGARQNSELN